MPIDAVPTWPRETRVMIILREEPGDAFEDAPIELALTIDPVFDGAGERHARLAWCRN
jgi:hypothetical protein